jgi:hypothetical protein
MKNFLFLINIIYFASINCFAQTSKIDIKNGFRNYKLGSNYSLYKNKIVSAGSFHDGLVKSYSPIENISVATYPAKTEIHFYKNKLYIIELKFENITESNFEGIYEQLSVVYGKSEELYYLDAPKYYNLRYGDRIIHWESKSILIEFLYIENSKQGILSIMSKIIQKQISNDEL